MINKTVNFLVKHKEKIITSFLFILLAILFVFAWVLKKFSEYDSDGSIAKKRAEEEEEERKRIDRDPLIPGSAAYNNNMYGKYGTVEYDE